MRTTARDRPNDPTPPAEAGLRPTEQAPVSPIATVDLDEATATEAWRDLLAEPAVLEAFVRSVRDLARDRTPADLLDALEERDVPRHLHAKIDAVARGDRRRAWRLAADVLPGLGRGRSTVDDVLATASLFGALEDAPTLAVRVGRPFRERDRRQREDVLALVATLARGFDLRLVSSRLTRLWLADEHRTDLPVSIKRDARRDSSPLSDRVDEALATLDVDGREASLLEELADEPAETLPYHALYASALVGKSRVRQCVGRLADLGLVETFGPPSDRRVELLDAGAEFLDEIGRQSTLSGLLEKSQSPVRRPCRPTRTSRPPDEAGAEGPPDGGPYRTRFLDRPGHHAAAACAPSGGVGLERAPVDGATDRTRLVSFDEERDEAVVSVRATSAFSAVVSLAIALASPRFIDKALPPERLESIDDPPAILRDARCVGWLSDEALADGQTLRDRLVEAGEEIADGTREMQNGDLDADERKQLRSDLMRESHGLAGSVSHLLDAAADVDLVREVRVANGMNCDDLDALAKSIGISAAIQARYGAFSVYRQLFEDRTHKRRRALTPDVDAADPLGSIIGGFVLRGRDVHRLRSHLEDHLAAPRELAEDAPELAVHAPLRDVGRPAYAAVATRMLDAKNLRVTRDAVSILHALAGSPHAVARALEQLESEDRRREVRPDEIRFALAHLDADRLVSALPPTVGKIVAALLTAEAPLNQTTLADRAGVSPQSIRNNTGHLENLADLGLVDADGGTYRLALSFRTQAERRNPVTPDAPDTFTGAVDVLLAATLPPDRYADPEDPVGGALFWPPDDPWGVADEDAALEPWLRLAAALTATERPDVEATVTVGPALEQAPLPGQNALAEVPTP